MDRFRQKSKNDKPLKHVDKEKPAIFITDVKTIKENLKIKEILRSVKMNSSMRMKAPRGSVVMNNNDFSDVHEEDAEGIPNVEAHNETLLHPQEVNNAHVNSENKSETQDGSGMNDSNELLPPDNTAIYDRHESDENLNTDKSNLNVPDIDLTSIGQDKNCNVKCRERKLSLDHTMLSRREGLSQSEVDLHSIGKSPLERKSSFFRKKMDSFLKNTSEIFKRQSSGTKPTSINRRSSISVSLQSLSENATMDSEIGSISKSNLNCHQAVRGSRTSINSLSTVGALSELGSSGSQAGSQPIQNDPKENSLNNLNEAHLQDSLLNSRAISMSSGLDSALGQRRRKSSRSNRVTWVASEGLTNYLRRLTQDESTKEMHSSHSYQDFSSISESSLQSSKADSKGRRLSYQRAVSGEDPVMPLRYQDSTLRKRHLIPENSEANYELSNLLAEFSRNGVPELQGYSNSISDAAYSYLLWAEDSRNIEEFYDWKKLNPNEDARQAVIRELISTEALYIRHLISIVEVFIAAAHAIQDSGKMLGVDTERLFSNIPDVLNASLSFWEITIYPMLVDAVENVTPFNTEFMSPGFCRFRDLFQPYEKYVGEQSKALDYFRSLSNNTDFIMYLSWCHSHKACNRLQLSDIMVKPMQRLTKYSLILRRIIAHTDAEPERTCLIVMESFAKNYVLDLNRSIRQREELEKLDNLANSLEAFEIDFKDDDMDRYFRMYSQINLKAPMVNCLPSHSRSLIHQGDLRFKDNVKEVEVRVFLLTDMMLICKKLSKGSVYPFKLIRPKYMVDKMIHFPKFSTRNNKDMVAIVFVMLDEVGSACHSFALSESTKDPNPHATLKTWESKVKEAKITYDLGVWFARNPSRDLSEVEMDSSSDYAISVTSASKMGVKQASDDLNIEREARERVAAMLHRSMGASTEYDFSQASMTTDSFDGDVSGPGTSAGGRTPALHSLRHPMQRNSTSGSSRTHSRLSSFHQSTSAASHDEPQAGPSKYNYYRAGSSVEHLIPPMNPDDAVTSITVNVVSESESETVVPSHQPTPSPHKLGSTRSPSVSSHNTLRVQPQSGVLALVHSLPDLTLDPSPPRPPHSPIPLSASEKLYQSHQELLQRNRLSAAQHHQYLSPNHRGTSYPPPSPTRASLKRGLAFSDSFKNPPLSKMGHVNSQSQLQAEAGPSAGPSTSSTARGPVGPSTSSNARGSSAGPSTPSSAKGPTAGPSTSSSAKNEKDAPTPSTSSEKEKKSKSIISSRNKGGSNGGNPGRNRKEDKSD